MENSNKIELSNGYAILYPFIKRKTAREYRKKLLHGSRATPSEDGVSKVDFDASSFDDANDILVKGSIKEYFVDGKVIEITDDSFDEMPNDDYEKILGVVMLLMKNEDEEKKSS